ncbi:alpha-amylase [Clostridiaceae bacterium M8S5]|nr:alpha-amylase [Clostridiaceae bacterium M8S5]
MKKKAVLSLVLIALLSINSCMVFGSFNGTIMQYFEWYNSNDGQHWNKVANDAKHLSDLGITAVWLPPAYKGHSGINDVGYGVYDLYDLGEFNQKGTVRTKYGTKDQYLNAINQLHKNNVQVYADIVLNHKMGNDYNENITVTEVNPRNRYENYSTFTKNCPTGYTFPGRNGKYSTFTWNHTHFDGIDDYGKIYRIYGRSWDNNVDWENGNYDYLMGADLDMQNSTVVNELKNWGNWYTSFAKLDGYRVDAIKHISTDFYSDWLDNQRSVSGKELFTVGEYWSADLSRLENYLKKTNYKMSLFDVPLHSQFVSISYGNGNFDMGSLGQNTLTKKHSTKSVTFVDNHDSQPGQMLGPSVNEWFKPQAYAYILTRQEGYPCVFYGDYYGVSEPGKTIASIKERLDVLLKVRKDLAFGYQRDYFDHKDIIGWTREGDSEHHKSGIAVLLNDGPQGSKWMCVGKKHAGKVFYDITGNSSHTVTINNDGWAEFKVGGGSYSVYVIR